MAFGKSSLVLVFLFICVHVNANNFFYFSQIKEGERYNRLATEQYYNSKMGLHGSNLPIVVGLLVVVLFGKLAHGEWRCH